jgi:hypothetical protein
MLSRWSVSPARASEPAVRVAAQRALHELRWGHLVVPFGLLVHGVGILAPR